MSNDTKPRIDIIELATGRVVKSIPLRQTDERYVERVLMGLLRQMDTERFAAREVLS
jgi:hypothetical protein